MKTTKLLRSLAAVAAVTAACVPALAQMTIDFSSARGTGAEQHKMLIENIRVLVPVPNPFSPGTYTTQESTYSVMFNFDPSTLHLVPANIVQSGGSGASSCANVSVTVYNSVRGESSPLSGATVTIGTRSATTDSSGVATFTGLAEGTTAVSVASNGFNPATQNATLTCGTSSNRVNVALSPAAGQAGGLGSGQFRVILTWGQNPGDLDSHLTGPSGSSRFHLYYSSRSAGGCGLDVDDTTSFGPETVTCPATGASSTTLPAGVYRYSVHHYSGSGNLGTSSANVRLEFGNGTVYNYTPPTTGWRGSNDVWTVFELTVNANGTVSVAPVNRVTNGTSAGSVQRPKPGAVFFGSTEDPALFRGVK